MTDHQHPTAKPEGEGAPVDAAKWMRELSVLVSDKGRRLRFLHFGEKGFARCASLDSGPPGSFAVKTLKEEAEPTAEDTNEWIDDMRVAGRELKPEEAKRAYEIIKAALSASPPVPAVAGEWDSLIDYLENQTAKTDEGRAIIAEWIAQAKALNAPTPSADQSGRVRDRLLKATEAASRLSTTTEEDAAVIDELVAASAEARQHLHHTADQSGVIGALEAVLSEKLERRTLALDEANARIGALVEALEEIERASYANSEEEGIARQALAAHAASIGGKS